MLGTEMVPEMSVSSYNQLTRLIVREDFIEFSRCGNFKPYFSYDFRSNRHQSLSHLFCLPQPESLLEGFHSWEQVAGYPDKAVFTVTII
jgi:hypothetical protein